MGYLANIIFDAKRTASMASFSEWPGSLEEMPGWQGAAAGPPPPLAQSLAIESAATASEPLPPVPEPVTGRPTPRHLPHHAVQQAPMAVTAMQGHPGDAADLHRPSGDSPVVPDASPVVAARKPLVQTQHMVDRGAADLHASKTTEATAPQRQSKRSAANVAHAVSAGSEPSSVTDGDDPVAGKAFARSRQAAMPVEAPAELPAQPDTAAIEPINPGQSRRADDAPGAAVSNAVAEVLPGQTRSAPLPSTDMNQPRAWSNEPRHAAEVQARQAEPRVHIGRIDVVISAPEPVRQSSVPAPSTGDLASRMYLRRL